MNSIPVESEERIQRIPIGRLLASKSNPRKELRELDDLVASVKQSGILVPLTVEQIGGNYRIIAGWRRLAAAKEAGLKTLPCIVRRYSDDDRLDAMLIDNIQRNDLDPIEEAEAYGQLYDRGLTLKQIGERVGKGTSTIGLRLKLLDLSVADQKAIKAGKLGMMVAVGYLPLPTPGYCRTCGRRLPAKPPEVKQ